MDLPSQASAVTCSPAGLPAQLWGPRSHLAGCFSHSNPHAACRDRNIDLTAQISAHSITWVSEQLMKGRNSGNYGNYGERLYVEGLMELEKRRAAVRAWHQLCCGHATNVVVDSERQRSQCCQAVGVLDRKWRAGLRDGLGGCVGCGMQYEHALDVQGELVQVERLVVLGNHRAARGLTWVGVRSCVCRWACMCGQGGKDLYAEDISGPERRCRGGSPVTVAYTTSVSSGREA